MYKEEYSKLKNKLVAVCPDKLADTLLEAALNNEIVMQKVQRLVASQKEKVSNFKQILRQIKSRRTYYSWKESSLFADELYELLNHLKDETLDPKDGFELICDFYRADERFFEQADDSDGNIGDVFRSDAIELFANFASKHPDRQLILKTVIELNDGDEYGARNDIIENAHKFLSLQEMRELFSTIENDLNKESENTRSCWELESLAKQMKDAPLFEKLIYKSTSPPNSRYLTDIAEVYFSCGNLEKAQEFLNLIPSGDTYASYEQEKLQKEIYKHTGNNESLYNLLYKAFTKQFSESSLNELINVAGENKRWVFIQEALKSIESDTKWNSFNAQFLVSVNQPECLEQYIFKHYDEINGDFYTDLLDLTKFLEQSSKYLAATVLYRSLIHSILRRAQSKYYHHGVKYLKNLDKIAGKIDSWNELSPHEKYLNGLKTEHKLKRSFWGQYSE